MGAKALINSHPKKFGKGGRRCRVCGNQQAIIRKYNMNICRQCFRTYAKDNRLREAPPGLVKKKKILTPVRGSVDDVGLPRRRRAAGVAAAGPSSSANAARFRPTVCALARYTNEGMEAGRDREWRAVRV